MHYLAWRYKHISLKPTLSILVQNFRECWSEFRNASEAVSVKEVNPTLICTSWLKSGSSYWRCTLSRRHRRTWVYWHLPPLGVMAAENLQSETFLCYVSMCVLLFSSLFFVLAEEEGFFCCSKSNPCTILDLTKMKRRRRMFRFYTVSFLLTCTLYEALYLHLTIVLMQASPWSLPKFCSRVWMWRVCVLAPLLLLPEGRSSSGGEAVSNPVFADFVSDFIIFLIRVWTPSCQRSSRFLLSWQ